MTSVQNDTSRWTHTGALFRQRFRYNVRLAYTVRPTGDATRVRPDGKTVSGRPTVYCRIRARPPKANWPRAVAVVNVQTVVARHRPRYARFAKPSVLLLWRRRTFTLNRRRRWNRVKNGLTNGGRRDIGKRDGCAPCTRTTRGFAKRSDHLHQGRVWSSRIHTDMVGNGWKRQRVRRKRNGIQCVNGLWNNDGSTINDALAVHRSPNVDESIAGTGVRRIGVKSLTANVYRFAV